MATPAAQAQNPWTPVLRGLLAVLFGLLLLVWPGLALFTLQVLIGLFGAYALVDGILAIAATVKGIRQHNEWWPHLVEGVLGISFAALVFIWTSITVMALLYVIALWAICSGALKIISGLQQSEWLLVAAGAASVIFGLVIVAFAGASMETVIFIIGVYAVSLGMLLLGQAVQASR